MFSCQSRTRSENSNFPLKQVENRLRDVPLARHLAAALPSTSNANRVLWSSTRNQKSTLRHLAAAFTSTSLPSDLWSPDRPPSCGCTHNPTFVTSQNSNFSPQIPTPAILRLHSQSISGQHLADALATTFTLNLCHFSKIPTKIHIPLPAI